MDRKTCRGLQVIGWIGVAHVIAALLLYNLADQPVFEVLASILLCVAIAAWISWVPLVWSIFTTGFRDPSDVLGLGIWLGFTANILQRVFVIFWEAAGRPFWVFEKDFRSYVYVLMIIAFVLHFAMAGLIDNRVPRRRWIILGVTIGTGVGLAMLLGWAI